MSADSTETYTSGTMKLEFYPATLAKRYNASVLVIPGGRFQYVGNTIDGVPSADWLNQEGFDAWVLSQYSCGDHDATPLSNKPMRDAEMALEIIRDSKDFQGELAIWGWSAGGTVAGLIEHSADIKLLILAYPVITMEDDFTHRPSRDNLLGKAPSQEQIERMSVDKHVTECTPPTFLFHTVQDLQVPLENSLLFARAMKQNGRPFALHVQKEGDHGVGLKGWQDINLKQWLRDILCKRPIMYNNTHNLDDYKLKGGYIQNHEF